MKTPVFTSWTAVLWAGIALSVAGCVRQPGSPAGPSTESNNSARSKLVIPEKRAERQPPAIARSEPATPAPDPVVVANAVEDDKEKEVPPEADPPIPDSFKPLTKDKRLFFEKTEDGKRRVHILAEVCLRDGPLEVLLCKANTKEHEAILRADVDGREIHTALLAAGAKFGSTVKFQPEYKPARGDVIKVTLTYNLDGKLQTMPAQSWIHQRRTKKQMEHDWVFAGSRFFQDPDNQAKPPFYCANNGELISIANFPDSMLDLPVQSSKEEAELGFGATTERIPPLKTKVLITLEPVTAEKK